MACALAGLFAGCGGGGKIEDRVAVGQEPAAAVAADDAMWVLNSDAVAKVDPDSNELALKKFIPAGEGADGIAAGANALWVSCNIDGTIVVIDPKAAKRVARIQLRGRVTDVAYGEGAVWATEVDTHNVRRIDPATRKPIGAPIRVGIAPSSVTTGEGSVWVTNQYGYTVSRIDPATNRVVATIKVGVQPTDIAVGEGAVWVANSNSDSVSRIDPKTNGVAATIKLGGNNVRSVITAFGSVWATEVDAERIARIDPGSNKDEDSVDLGGDKPTDLATGFGTLWVPIAESNLIARVKP